MEGTYIRAKLIFVWSCFFYFVSELKSALGMLPTSANQTV
jgi:hypothetical protein